MNSVSIPSYRKNLQTILYLGAINIFTAVVALIQFVYVANALGAASIGLIAVIAGFGSLTTNFFDLRATDIALRLFYARPPHTQDQVSYRCEVIQGCILINIAITVIILICICAFITWLSSYFTTQEIEFRWVIQQGIATSLGYFSSSQLFLQRLTGHIRWIGIIRVGAQILAVGAFLLCFYGNPGLEGYFRYVAASSIVTTLWVSVATSLVWSRYHDMKIWTNLRYDSVRFYWYERTLLFGSNLFGYVKMLHRGSDALVVGFFLGDHLTGFYRTARLLTDQMYTLSDAASQIYQPQLSAFLSTGCRREFIRLAGHMITVAAGGTLFFVLLELACLERVTTFLFGQSFEGLPPMIMVLTLPFFFVYGLHGVLWSLALHRRKMFSFVTMTMLGVFCQVFLVWQFSLRPQIAPFGGAVGYLAYYIVSYLGLMIWFYFRGRKAHVSI